MTLIIKYSVHPSYYSWCAHMTWSLLSSWKDLPLIISVALLSQLYLCHSYFSVHVFFLLQHKFKSLLFSSHFITLSSIDWKSCPLSYSCHLPTPQICIINIASPIISCFLPDIVTLLTHGKQKINKLKFTPFFFLVFYYGWDLNQFHKLETWAWV